MHRRNVETSLLAALSDTPVVLLKGARQAGKSTLVRDLLAERHSATYLTLDDAAVLSAASADPAGFIDGLGGSVVIDEVQRVPELFLAIKAAVDRDRRPGRFLLTGSADVMLLPRVADALVGRVEPLTLWPLSQGELAGMRETFVDAVLSPALDVSSPASEGRLDLLDRIVSGGFPEAVARKSEARRRAWFGSYLTTVLQRDVRDLAQIEGLTALPRLLSLVAARSGSLLNASELSRTSGLPNTTLRRYLVLFETAFLVHLLPAWAAGLESRLVKSPRVHLCDSGLACHLMGVDPQRLRDDPNLVVPLLEGFVTMELRKQSGWSRAHVSLYHFRTHAGQEVDLVMESDDGAVVGIEVKAASTVGARDFKGLRALQEVAGARFRRGIVLYGGRQLIPYAPNLHAVPLESLWSHS